MRLSTPIPFRDAILEIARRDVLPTSLRGAELEAVAEQFMEDSIFSAGNLIEDSLEQIKESVQELLQGKTDRAKARLKISQSLRKAGYTPSAEDAGTISDLGSDARINLVVNHWTKFAREKGHTIRNNDSDLLQSHPCYELVRIGDRDQKRHWIERWRGNGGRVFPGYPAGPSLNPELVEGRLIAKKDDPIWFKISRFNRAEPPYDFNSGVSRRAVPRAEAEKLGVIKPGERTGPTPSKSLFPDPEESN